MLISVTSLKAMKLLKMILFLFSMYDSEYIFFKWQVSISNFRNSWDFIVTDIETKISIIKVVSLYDTVTYHSAYGGLLLLFLLLGRCCLSLFLWTLLLLILLMECCCFSFYLWGAITSHFTYGALLLLFLITERCRFSLCLWGDVISHFAYGALLLLGMLMRRRCFSLSLCMNRRHFSFCL